MATYTNKPGYIDYGAAIRGMGGRGSFWKALSSGDSSAFDPYRVGDTYSPTAEERSAQFAPAKAAPQLALGKMGGPITQARNPFSLPTASPAAQGQTEVSKALRAAPAAPAMSGGQ